MHVAGVVVAGCAPGEPDCAAGTVPNGLDTWFIVLMLILLASVALAAVVLLGRRTAHRAEAASGARESTGRAQVP